MAGQDRPRAELVSLQVSLHGILRCRRRSTDRQMGDVCGGGLYLLDVLLRAHTCDGHLLSALMPESLYVCVHGAGHTRQNATPLHQGGSM